MSSDEAAALNGAASRSLPAHGEDKIHTRVVALVGLTFLCDFLLLTVVVPILPAVFAGTPWGRPLVVAAAFASKPLAQIISNPAAGACVGRRGPRRLLLVGGVVLVVSSGMFALSLIGMSTGMAAGTVFWCCVGARVVQGVASALVGSAGMTLVVETHAAEHRGAAVGVASSGIALGALLGPPLGGVLGAQTPWLPFAALSALLVFNILFQLCAVGIPDTDTRLQRGRRQISSSTARPSSTGFFDDDDAGQKSGGYSYAVSTAYADESTVAFGADPLNSALLHDNAQTHDAQMPGRRRWQPSEHPRRLHETTTCNLLRDPRILTVAAILTISNAAVGILEALVPLYMQSTILCAPPTNASNVSGAGHTPGGDAGSSVVSGDGGTNCGGGGAERQNAVMITGLVFAASTLSYLVCTPLAGWLGDRCANRADRLNRRWVVIFCGSCVLGCAMSLFYVLGDAFGGGWPGMVGGLVGIGVGMALIEPPAGALLADIMDARGSTGSDVLGIVFSLQNSAISLGFAAGPLLGAAVEESLESGAGGAAGAGFRAMSLAFGVACLAFVPCLCVLRRTETMAAISEEGGRRTLPRRPSTIDAPSFLGEATGPTREDLREDLRESLLTAPIISQ